MPELTTLKTDIMHRHGTDAFWRQRSSFVPKPGELIFYDVDSSYDSPRAKLGDGVTKLTNLPFMFDPITNEEIDQICR